jgi:hypothetical protein
MGNVQSIQEIEKTNQIVNEIMKFECCLLDIGDMMGQTDYIDFITENILAGHDVMKGVDKYGRSFIVVKAHIMYKDIFIANTFTTFFQRYDDDNTLWMACGNKGIHLMATEGGMSLIQLELLRNLLYNRAVKIDNSRDTRIYTDDSHKDDIMDIHLGYKVASLLKQESNCISQYTDTKMNQQTSIKDIISDLPESIQNYLLDSFDDQAEENENLRKELELANVELNKKNAEIDSMKKYIDKMNKNTLSIPKPEFKRQTNMITYNNFRPNSEPKTRIWENTLDDEDMENDPLFQFMTMKREKAIYRRDSF